MKRLHTGALVIALLCGCLAATACGGGDGSGGGSGAPTTTTRGATPTPKADTTLCDLISPAQFSQVVGDQVTKVTSSTSHTSLAQIVLCTYLPASQPGSGGAIDYALSDDGAAYYAKVKLGEQSNLSSVTEVSGVGDAAFWGIPTEAHESLDFDLRKGNWVVGMVFEGSAASGSAYLAGAEQMAKAIASKL